MRTVMFVATKTQRRKPQPSITRETVTRLEDLPNVGPSIAADLRGIGVSQPGDLAGRDPYALFDELCAATGVRHDPCVLDVFISAVRFMEGAPASPWWHYTAERKRALAARTDSPARSQPPSPFFSRLR
jgi:hypothetical protein